MDELLQQFLVEGRDLVAEAHGALIALARSAKDGAALASLFRATHTLKGSVALFDMRPAEALLHAAESRLDAARKGGPALDGHALDALVAIIDQTDRWIDAMERSGALEEDAGETARRLASLIEERGRDDDGADAGAAPPRAMPAGDAGPGWAGPGWAGAGWAGAGWIERLRSRPRFSGVDFATVRTAFRYTPDPDCFFRGEDPLAMAAAVPGLIALAVLPADGDWPALEACEPFRCMAAIEGVSGADIAQVRAAFRLVPDQILLAPLPPEEPPPRGAPAEDAAVTLRVDAAKLDRLADLSGELGVAIRGLEPIADRLRGGDPGLAAALRSAREEIERVAGALQRAVAQARLVPLEPVLRRLPRLAREAAAELGKPVRFTLAGESTQVDKQIADQLFEPLLHLVRNAVDHGVENPAERAAAGKPAESEIALSVTQDGGGIVILLADDGRGIDPAAIRDSAVARGLVSPEAAQALSDEDARRLILLPGFSTTARATSLSGRGVGMDAVLASVERLGGTIAIASEIGRGTRITLRLPAHAISTPLLVVEAGGRKLGLRIDQVVETARIAAAAIQPVGPGMACLLRDATVPVIDLAGALGLGALGLGEAIGDQARLVVVDAGSGSVALRVTRFGQRIDGVVRERTGMLARLPAIAGTTMMADGSVLLVLDLAELIA